MSLYTVTIASVALNSAADTLTLVAPATRPLRLLELCISGLGATSAANNVVLARSSGGATGGGAITPRPLNPNDAAATFNAFTTWATQPTLGAALKHFGVNSNGGEARFMAVPGAEIKVRVGEQLSLRAVSGTGTVTVTATVEEVDA